MTTMTRQIDKVIKASVIYFSGAFLTRTLRFWLLIAMKTDLLIDRKEMIFMKKAWFTFKYLVILYCIMTTVFDLVVCWRDDIKKAKEYYND